MKAIILAAGVGSRIPSVSKYKPKCFVEINGKTILQQLMDVFHAVGIKDISIVIGYKRGMIQQKFRGENIKWYVNPLYRSTGMLESLYCAKKEFDDDCLIVYGDVYIKEKVAKRLAGCSGDFCIAIDQKVIPTKREDAFETYSGKTFRKGKTMVKLKKEEITQIGKNIITADGIYIGLLKVSRQKAKEIMAEMDILKKKDTFRMFPSPSYLLQLLLEKGERMNAVKVSHKDYAEIDYVADLIQARKKFTTQNPQ